MDAEHPEHHCIKKIRSWRNKLKKIAIDHLTMKNVYSPPPKQTLIPGLNQRNTSYQETSQIQKEEGSEANKEERRL